MIELPYLQSTYSIKCRALLSRFGSANNVLMCKPLGNVRSGIFSMNNDVIEENYSNLKRGSVVICHVVYIQKRSIQLIELQVS